MVIWDCNLTLKLVLEAEDTDKMIPSCPHFSGGMFV